MATKILNIDFYQVQVEDKEQRKFADLLEVMLQTPDDEGRAQHRSDDAIRLQGVTKSKTLWHSDMLRIRMNEVPVKAKLSGKTEEIELDEDEGLGEDTAFLFHVPSNVLVLQRNRSGVSASALAKYFKVLCKCRSVVFKCLLKEDALNRIARMENVRGFELHFAGVQTGRSLRGKGHSVRTIYSMLNEFEAPNATIRLTVGRKKGTLQHVREAIADLFTQSAEQEDDVKKVIVIGSEGDDDEKMVVDLFQDRLTEAIEVEVDAGQRIPDVRRFKALSTAWDRNKAYIESKYVPEA